MNAAQTAKQAMEMKLSAIAGRQVEITIRGECSFTFYFDGVCEETAQRLADAMQAELANGWRILAIQPQPDQRRPDYILGRPLMSAMR